MSLRQMLLATCVAVLAIGVVHSNGLADGDENRGPAQPPAMETGSVRPDTFKLSTRQIRPTAASDTATGASPARTDSHWTLPTASTPAALPRTANRSEEIDLGPLRYFAAHNDLARVAAEIKLLREKHPGWEPPQDLFEEGQAGEDEQPLWDLFAAHDYAGVRAKIEAKQAEHPDWQPSHDLLNKLALGEAKQSLSAAYDARNWSTLIEIATANPMLLACNDVDALWKTAEALVRSGQEDQGVAAYRFILQSCSNPAERLATVQKANELLANPARVDELIAMGVKLADGHSEFEQVRLDQMRRRVGALASGKVGPGPSPLDLETLASHARSAGGASDAQLLGWYYLAAKGYTEAESWFTVALQSAKDPKAAEGLVLALRDGGKADAALKAALQYGDLDHANRRLVIELLSARLNEVSGHALTADENRALAKAVDTESSSDGAQALAWSAYRAGNAVDAQGWFRKAAKWQMSEPVALGLALCARRLKQDRDYLAVMGQYRATYPALAELELKLRPRRVASVPAAHRVRSKVARRGAGRSRDGSWDRSADQIVSTFQSGNYDQAMAMLEQRQAVRRSEPKGLALVRGWALYHRGDWDGAKRVFADVAAKGYSPEAQKGLSQIEYDLTPKRYR